MKTLNFKLPHITLAALSWGDSDKPKILALHGWLDNAASFIPLSRYVEGYHVIAIDWPGHGLSGHRPVGANYQLIDYVYDIFSLIKLEGWGKVHIVGHSLGAIVASIFSASFPELIDKLVLIEGLGPISAEPEHTRDNIRKSALAQLKLRDKNKPVHPTIVSAATARKNAGDFSLEIATLLVQRALEPIDNGYTWRSDMRLRIHSAWRMSEAQAQDIVGAIRASTLLIIATDGMAMVSEGLHRRRNLIDSLSVLELSGGHHVHMEQPLLTWQAITSHLNSQNAAHGLNNTEHG